jgi:Fe2+ or Zn2+ uptake regulation protein
MIILEELRKVTSHPTAYEIYETVRSRIPQISLGTVYRNLEHLSSSGEIRKLDSGQGQRRFDAVVEDHLHIQCLKCGKVEDIPFELSMDMSSIKEVVTRQCGYDILNYSIDFQGVCPSCKERRCA